jgi:sialic acid synthase SpsE
MTLFIADLCSNHNQDLPRTLKLIDAAKDAGCWGVKLQLFKAKNLFHPSFPDKIKKMQKWEFPEKFLPDITMHCKDIDIKFGCTPFDLAAVDTLNPYIDFFKIGSYENQYTELIQKVVDTKKDWMVSMGMMDIINVGKFMKQNFIQKNKPKVIFHCSSTYPAKPENCGLSNIRHINNYIKVDTGWSDHSGEPGVIHKAVNIGAKYIEFHLDLGIEDRKGFESEIGHCWTPSEIKKVINDVEIGEKAEFNYEKNYDSEAKKWRTDFDGFRPLKIYRKELLKIKG